MPDFDVKPRRAVRPRQADEYYEYGEYGQRGGRAVRRRKENMLLSFARGLLPWKGDSPGDVVRKLIFLGSLILIIYAALTLVDFYVLRDRRIGQERKVAIDLVENYKGDDKVTLYFDDGVNGSGGGARSVEILGKYQPFYEKNNDFIGWVEIKPFIQDPVYQALDNEFYLKHNGDKIPTENGTIFTDWEGVFTEYARPHNTIIYGHNLRTNNLFQPLTFYRDRQNSGVDAFDFLKEHAVIKFDTLYEEGFYKIFAVFQSNVKEYQGEIFRYWDHVYFTSKSQFDSFVADCLDRSMYFTNVDLEYGDELLMLSTCDFSMFANGSDSSVRLVVAARRVRDTEYWEFSQSEIDAFIDNRGRNEAGDLKYRMFEAYYELRGTQWAGRNWDTGYIKDFNADG